MPRSISHRLEQSGRKFKRDRKVAGKNKKASKQADPLTPELEAQIDELAQIVVEFYREHKAGQRESLRR